MPLTTDPLDPELEHGTDTEPRPQARKYLILSDEERAKGFLRPVRDRYLHVGPPGPIGHLRDLTEVELHHYKDVGYVKFEKYPDSMEPRVGRFWTQAELDRVQKGGCGTETIMANSLAETYAREPSFYGATYCAGCQKHLPVNEFVWSKDGTRVGS